VGSISHSDLSVWAVVSDATRLRSIGIDTESVDRAGKVDIRSAIASDEEWSLVNKLGFDAETTLAMVFSAKESFYKCWYPITNRYFDFPEAVIVDANEESLSISHGPLNPNQGRLPQILDVRYRVRAGEVFTATWISDLGDTA
jgi:4'-phosphopantetheinyl transferase EntD